jgi:hypothetical protein
VHGQPLATGGRRTGEHHGFTGPASPFQEPEHGFVVELGVVVVHLPGIGTVVPDDFGRDPLAEVGFEAVHTLVEEPFEPAQIPGGGVRVGEVDQSHAGLPLVPLPDSAVRGVHQVALRGTLLEQRGTLAEVRVDPHAHLEAPLVEPGEHALRVGERAGVPFEVAPLVFAHPEGVEVEHAHGQVAPGHPVDEPGDGAFVVAGGERRRQPQAERPRGNPGGPAGQRGVAGQDLLG